MGTPITTTYVLVVDQLLALSSGAPNTGVEKPSLQHFGATVVASAYLPSGGGNADTGTGPGPLGVLRRLPTIWIVGALAGSVLVGVCLVVLGPRLMSRRARRLPEMAAIPFGAVAVLCVLMLVPKSTALSTTAPVPPASTAAAAHSVQSSEPPTPFVGDQLWQRLSTIEVNVAQLETRLQRLTTLAAQSKADDVSLQPRWSPSGLALDPAVQAQRTAVQLEGVLHEEYAFYVAAVHNADTQQALIAAAHAQPDAVRTIVAYNVQAVRAELAQEAAITAAQNALPSRNGPAPSALTVPMSGTISQPFGPSALAMEAPFIVQGVAYPHFHTGVDITAPLDSSVVAAADGLVVIAGSSTDAQGHPVGYGNYVVVAHEGRMVTLYGHLDKFLVQAGQRVHAGDLIGLEGSTGYSTGPHLHFEVRNAGLLVDPMTYLAGRLH